MSEFFNVKWTSSSGGARNYQFICVKRPLYSLKNIPNSSPLSVSSYNAIWLNNTSQVWIMCFMNICRKVMIIKTLRTYLLYNYKKKLPLD